MIPATDEHFAGCVLIPWQAGCADGETVALHTPVFPGHEEPVSHFTWQAQAATPAPDNSHFCHELYLALSHALLVKAGAKSGLFHSEEKPQVISPFVYFCCGFRHVSVRQQLQPAIS